MEDALCSGLLLITGGPGTGKTTILNGILELLGQMQLRCLLAAPTGRAAKRLTEVTGEEASTIHRLLEATIDTNSGEMYFVRDEENPLKTDVIIVDECQFLLPEQIDQLRSIVNDYNIPVMCFGLRTDFQTKMFEGSRRLFEIADTIDEIKSTCSCGRKTIVNARIDSNGDIITVGEQVEIGGNDRYIAVCRKCWRNKRIEHSDRNSLPFDK